MGATGRFVTLGVAPGNKKRYLDFCIFGLGSGGEVPEDC
jgi:hypothetical protein